MEYISKSEEETYRIARQIAFKADGGDIFAFEGDLGSGKTTFIKGFAKALGIEKEVTSPTFVLLKKYDIPDNKKDIKSLVHVDCYRMGSAMDAESIGLPDYFNDAKSIVLLEWPSKIKDILPERTIVLSFEFIDEDTRKIQIDKNYLDRR